MLHNNVQKCYRAEKRVISLSSQTHWNESPFPDFLHLSHPESFSWKASNCPSSVHQHCHNVQSLVLLHAWLHAAAQHLAKGGKAKGPNTYQRCWSIVLPVSHISHTCLADGGLKESPEHQGPNKAHCLKAAILLQGKISHRHFLTIAQWETVKHLR